MKKKQKHADDPPRIGREADAVALLDEMIEDCAIMLSADAQSLYKPRLEALRDAIARGIA